MQMPVEGSHEGEGEGEGVVGGGGGGGGGGGLGIDEDEMAALAGFMDDFSGEIEQDGGGTGLVESATGEGSASALGGRVPSGSEAADVDLSVSDMMAIVQAFDNDEL